MRSAIKTVWLVFAMIAYGAVCLSPAFAQSVPANLRAAILLRALQYEKTFSSGAGEAKLLLLAGSKGGKDVGEMAPPLTQLGSSGAAGRKLRVESSNAESALDEAKKRGAQLVYVAVGNEGALASLSGLSGVIVLCGDPAAVGKGCTLSVEAQGSTSRLVIDLGSAEKSGLKFDARILRLARVIR